MEEQKKEDKRTQYSKTVIRKALFELMKTKSINKITVKEICELAQINRSTFYAYYTDIYDLNQKIIKEFFSKQHEIIAKTSDYLKRKPGITGLSVQDFYFITFNYVSAVKENKDLYKFIFNQNSTSSIHISFTNVFYHAIDDMLPDELHEIFRRSFTFISGGTSALLTEWLKNDCDTEVEKMAKSLAYYYNGVFNGKSMHDTPLFAQKNEQPQ